MQTLTTQSNNKKQFSWLSNGNRLFYTTTYEYFYWGKCYIEDNENKVIFMQQYGTCKDYVVDTYYRTTTHGFDSKLWNREQIEYPSVYIYTNKTNIKTYLKNIKEVLNPWEEKHGFVPTEAFNVDLTRSDLSNDPGVSPYILVLKYDPIWMTNSMTMSYFLSVVRHALQRESIYYDKGIPTVYNNEAEYYNRQSKILREVVLYSLDNPREYIDFVKDATPTGYLNETGLHGVTGLFYILNNFWQKYADDVKYRKTFKKTSIDAVIYNHPNAKYIEYVVNKLEEQKLENVKMQSLQQKTKRPRTRKKVTTNTEELIHTL